jgi:hypothetical protein
MRTAEARSEERHLSHGQRKRGGEKSPNSLSFSFSWSLWKRESIWDWAPPFEAVYPCCRIDPSPSTALLLPLFSWKSGIRWSFTKCRCQQNPYRTCLYGLIKFFNSLKVEILEFDTLCA